MFSLKLGAELRVPSLVQRIIKRHFEIDVLPHIGQALESVVLSIGMRQNYGLVTDIAVRIIVVTDNQNTDEGQ